MKISSEPNKQIRRIPILLYHKIGYPPNGVRNPRTYVAPEQFQWQMRLLYRWGYRTISPEELVLHYRGGKLLDGQRVLITFDDGSETCYSTAWPILSEFGFTALLFLVARQFGGCPQWERNQAETAETLLMRSQVEEMIRHGFTIGAHSLSHARLTELSLIEARREIEESRSRLEQDLQSSVDYFAYPYGAYHPGHLVLVQEAGYCAAFTTHYPEGGLFAIRRQNIGLHVKRFRFLWRFYRAGRGTFSR